jgi:hypothetical protein
LSAAAAAVPPGLKEDKAKPLSPAGIVDVKVVPPDNDLDSEAALFSANLITVVLLGDGGVCAAAAFLSNSETRCVH